MVKPVLGRNCMIPYEKIFICGIVQFGPKTGLVLVFKCMLSLFPLLRFYFSLKILNKFECCTVSSLVEIGKVVRSREEVFLNVVNLSLVLWERCGSSFEQLN